jgi:hypothetical protein
VCGTSAARACMLKVRSRTAAVTNIGMHLFIA